MLKLDVAFLYDLLGASQEHKIKPKKFAQTDIDEVIIGHTNEAEYKKLLNNEFMEALRDRTIKIDIPYITKLSEEIKIYEKDFSQERLRGKHIAPHTLEVAAMWAVLTRLEEPKKHQHLAAPEDEALRRQGAARATRRTPSRSCARRPQREGMDGISPRYVQDKISQRARERRRRGLHQPVHGAERAREGPPAPLADHATRSSASATRS